MLSTIFILLQIPGKSTPKKLVKTLIYTLGLNLMLRSSEHRMLRPSMFYISDNEEYFTYTEWSSKANPGGLTRKKVKPKVVTVYKNENSVRCPVRLLKFYMEATQMNSNMVDKAFYLKPTIDGFANVPLGQHTIEAYHKSIYEDAGFSGYYTLHGENLLFLSLCIIQCKMLLLKEIPIENE